MPLVAIDSEALINAAMQLEARCDPAFIAGELRTLVASAPVAVHPELVGLFELALRTQGMHRCFNGAQCNWCDALERVRLSK